MGKIKFKKGITLIEVIVSMLLIFTLIFAFTFIIPKIYSNVNKSRDNLTESIFIENSYKIFTSDPCNFKNNINTIYNINLINDEVTKTMFESIAMEYYENNLEISVKIFYNEEEIEIWKRRKVIQ